MFTLNTFLCFLVFTAIYTHQVRAEEDDDDDDDAVFERSRRVASACGSAFTVTARVAENAAAGTSITDLSTQSQISSLGGKYFMRKTGPMVNVASNGAVTVGTSFNRETTATYTAEANFTSTTEGCSTIITLTITVTDVNENTPRFTTSGIIGAVSHSATAGTVLFTVMATDADAESTITFTLTPSTEFKIGTSSGEVTVKSGTLSIQTYTVTVTVSDGGNPVKTATEAIKIHSIDVSANQVRIEIDLKPGQDREDLKKAIKDAIKTAYPSVNVVWKYIRKRRLLGTVEEFYAMKDLTSGELLTATAILNTLQNSDGTLSAAFINAGINDVGTVTKLAASSSITTKAGVSSLIKCELLMPVSAFSALWLMLFKRFN